MRQFKERFLSRYDGATQEAYRRVLEKAGEYERKFRKDAANFTLEEAELFLYSQMSAGVYNIQNICVIMSVYTDFAIGENASVDNINHWRQVRNYQKFVNRAGMPQITRQSVAALCAEAGDPLLTYVLWAVFDGVGARDVGEIVSLRMSDFDGNWVNVGERRFQVSGQLLEAAREAQEQTCVQYQDGRTFKAIHQHGSIWYSRKICDDTQEARRYSFYNLIGRKKRLYGNSLNVVSIQKAGIRENYQKLFGGLPAADAAKREEYRQFRIQYDLPEDIYAVIRMMKWN